VVTAGERTWRENVWPDDGPLETRLGVIPAILRAARDVERACAWRGIPLRGRGLRADDPGRFVPSFDDEFRQLVRTRGRNLLILRGGEADGEIGGTLRLDVNAPGECMMRRTPVSGGCEPAKDRRAETGFSAVSVTRQLESVVNPPLHRPEPAGDVDRCATSESGAGGTRWKRAGWLALAAGGLASTGPLGSRCWRAGSCS
jgi:hypothetical protein